MAPQMLCRIHTDHNNSLALFICTYLPIIHKYLWQKGNEEQVTSLMFICLTNKLDFVPKIQTEDTERVVRIISKLILYINF